MRIVAIKLPKFISSIIRFFKRKKWLIKVSYNLEVS